LSEATIRVLGVGQAKEMRRAEGSGFSDFGGMGVDPCTTTVLPATTPCRCCRLIIRHLLSPSLSRDWLGFGSDRQRGSRVERFRGLGVGRWARKMKEGMRGFWELIG